MNNPFKKPAIVWTAISGAATVVFFITCFDPENVVVSILTALVCGFVAGGGIPAVSLWGRVKKWTPDTVKESADASNWVDNGFYAINTKENLIDVNGVTYDLSKVDKESISIDDQHDHHRGKAVSMNITVSFMVDTDYVSIIFLKKPKYLTSDDYLDAMAKAKKLVAILSK